MKGGFILSTTLYLKIEKNNEVSKKHVSLGDVSTIWCTDKSVTSKVKTIKLLNIQEDKRRRYSFSVMKIIELINQEYPNVEVQNIGETDFIIDYENKDKQNHQLNSILNIIKVMLICIITMFGSAYAIMAYDNDVSISEVFEKAYTIFLGDTGEGLMIIEIMYSIGLTLGIIIFYNHFGGKKITTDPTPLEVEMHTLECDIDDTLITRSSRTKEEGNC